MEKLRKKIKAFFQRILGITDINNKVHRLTQELETLQEKYEALDRACVNISYDNGVILEHIRFINSNFFVAADVQPSKYQPSCVLILKRGNQDEVHTFYFREETMLDIYSILQGFGKDNVKVDKPRGFPGPKFRY